MTKLKLHLQTGALVDLNPNQRDRQVEAALLKLVQDFPGTGVQALFQVHQNIASPIQIEMLCHPDRAMLLPDGQFTELGQAAMESVQNKINSLLQGDLELETSDSQPKLSGSLKGELTEKSPDLSRLTLLNSGFEQSPRHSNPKGM